MNAVHTELEVALHRGGDAAMTVELRFHDPANEAEIAPVRGPVALEIDELSELVHDPKAYGKLLAEQLFADPDVRSLYARALAVTESAGHSMRFRLHLGTSVPDLQSVRWELLLDPESGTPLATSERILFSRFMPSNDWRSVRLRPKAGLRALIAVSAPSDLDRYGLATVDAQGEVERVRAALGEIEVRVLGLDVATTPQLLIDALRDEVDIFYLVSHGAIHRTTGEPALFLQNDDGTTHRLRGTDLALRIAELDRPPRLAVLASCESAGTEEGIAASAQGSLAPHLAAAGVPAVLAMQGKISMTTVEKMMPTFFRELLVDGRIDRALARARGEVRERTDFWMPALFLRLKSGRIWYVPGFAGKGTGGEDEQFKKWRSLTESVRQGTFVPVLGEVLDDRLRGTRSDLARILAERHGFPFAPFQRGNLAKVAQYLTVRESRRFARTEILNQLRVEIARRLPHLEVADKDLKSLFKIVLHERYQNEDDPFRILAELGASVYIHAGYDSLLSLALVEAGAKPKPLYSEWRKTRDTHPREPEYQGAPDAQNPVVYHPFGFLAKAETLVLTEDDYMDFLIAATGYKLMPRVVRGTLVKSSLLFLGFDLEDWTFRTLFRLIMALDGSAQLGDFSHVGVQLDPSETEISDAEEAREYLQKYFGIGQDGPSIDIYWGSAGDFLQELRRQMQSTDEAPAPLMEDEDEDDWIF